eukprot:160659-Prymnesium_polylepis.1
MADGGLLQWGDMDDGPVPLPLADGVRVAQIACGAEHCLAAAEGGSLYAWGNNDDGQLGLGDSDERDEPCEVELPAGTLVRAVSAARGVSFALTADGVALSCGNDEQGQLGHAPPPPGAAQAAAEELDMGRCCEFHVVAVPRSVERITQLSCGPHHAAAVTDDARVLTWGCAATPRARARSRAPRRRAVASAVNAPRAARRTHTVCAT